MKLNIHSLYVTRSKDERDYFYDLLKFMIAVCKGYTKIVHLSFNWDDVYSNLKYNDKMITAEIYTFGKEMIVEKIYTFEDLVHLFTFTDNGNPNLFMYSGHSNGILLMKHNIRILKIEDFGELSYRTLGKKADVVVFDCCLCGNISVLNIMLKYSKYLISSSSYWSNLSLLYTKMLYQEYTDFVPFLIKCILEFIEMEKNTKNTFTTDIILYHLNDSVKELIHLVKGYLRFFHKSTSYVIDKAYYKDLLCVFKDIGINIQGLLDSFILFKRFQQKKCHSHLKSKNADSSWPSQLSIILKNPVKGYLSNDFF